MPFSDSEYPSILRGRDKRESQRLLAAAPDLLGAARIANAELISLGQGSSASPALVALWEAIAKAEGRE